MADTTVNPEVERLLKRIKSLETENSNSKQLIDALGALGLGRSIQGTAGASGLGPGFQQARVPASAVRQQSLAQNLPAGFAPQNVIFGGGLPFPIDERTQLTSSIGDLLVNSLESIRVAKDSRKGQ